MRLLLVQAYYDGSEYLTKLRARASQLKIAMDDEFAKARMILDVWSVNCEEFIETFLFLKIPSFQNAIKPFFMFDYQKRIIHKLIEAEQDTEEHTILIDKPREMGITWIIVAYFLWRWLFTPNWSGFILSRTEAEVDDGSDSPDNSIFGKIRWLISRLPRFIIPEGFTPKGKKGTSTDMTLKIMNPAMGSSINGSSTNANAGRSRRYSIAFIDECFFIENFTQVLRSMESVSRVKVLVSSARAGRQYENIKKMCEEKGDYIHLDWKDHPWKDDIWFKELERKAEFDPEIMREAVVSYAVDKKLQYYPQISQAKIDKVQYDKERPIYCFLDIGRGDLTVIGWCQYDGASFRIVEAYANKNKEIAWYAPFMNPEADYADSQYPTTNQKEILKKVRTWQKPKAWFGEQAHFAKGMATNKSCADVLATYGIRLMYNAYAIQYEPRRRATAQVLPMTVFNEDSPYVMEMYDALMNSRYANSVAPTSPQSVMKPVHDNEIADYRAAFENLSANLPRVLRLQRTETRTGESKDLTDGLLRYLKS